MTDTTNPNREQAREVLAAAIRRQGDSAASADGILAGRDHAVWANVAITAMLEFAALPTPEAERVKRNGAFDRGYLAGLKTAGWHVERNHPAAAEAIFARVTVIQDGRPTNDPDGSAGEVERRSVEKALRRAKLTAVREYGIAWLHLEEISRAELIVTEYRALHPTQDSRDVAGAAPGEASDPDHWMYAQDWSPTDA